MISKFQLREAEWCIPTFGGPSTELYPLQIKNTWLAKANIPYFYNKISKVTLSSRMDPYMSS